MSRLDEMIAELCPDGVEYKTIGELATDIFRGSGITRNQVTETGAPCVRYGEIYTTYGVWFDQCVSHTDEAKITNAKYFEHGDILFAITGESVEDIAKSTAYVGYEKCLAGGDIVVLRHEQDPKYLAYALTTTNARTQKSKGKVKSKVVHSSVPAIQSIVVPVPPLEVQREIVRVLDNFTFLSAELSAELSARRKQYEFYRNQLLTFDTDVRRIPMGDLFDFKNGLSKGKEFFGRGTPFIRYTDVYNHRSLKREDIDALVECTPDELRKLKVSRGDVLFTRTSETAEDVGWSSVMIDELENCVFNGFTIKATPKTDLLWPEYCAYCFATDEFRTFVTKRCAFTTRASLTGSTIAEYKLAVPSLDVQKKIAEVLDNFEAICNDLGIGLPAEIEARQKQYEYYRDLLLTFAETGGTLATDRPTDRPTDRQAEIALLQYVFGYACVELSQLFNTRNGYTPSKRNSDFWKEDADIPWFRMEDIRENGRILSDATQHVTQAAVKGALFPSDSFIISTSATIGEHAWIRVPSLANQRFTYLMLKQEYKDLVDYRYLYYYCFKLGEYCRAHLNQGNFASVDMGRFGEFNFFLPSLQKQQEIADILDRLDAICNDLSSGIPAEIDARQKQYDYYRDKLLTFKEKVN